MIVLSTSDKHALERAKSNCKKYQYGSIRHKSARQVYERLQEKLAEQYQCSIPEIKLAETRTT